MCNRQDPNSCLLIKYPPPPDRLKGTLDQLPLDESSISCQFPKVFLSAVKQDDHTLGQFSRLGIVGFQLNHRRLRLFLRIRLMHFDSIDEHVFDLSAVLLTEFLADDGVRDFAKRPQVKVAKARQRKNSFLIIYLSLISKNPSQVHCTLFLSLSKSLIQPKPLKITLLLSLFLTSCLNPELADNRLSPESVDLNARCFFEERKKSPLPPKNHLSTPHPKTERINWKLENWEQAERIMKRCWRMFINSQNPLNRSNLATPTACLSLTREAWFSKLISERPGQLPLIIKCRSQVLHRVCDWPGHPIGAPDHGGPEQTRSLLSR